METFIVLSNNVEGRLDPYYYQREFVLFKERFNKTKFSVKTFGEISEKITSGATPLSGGESYIDKENGVPFIRSGNINEEENIDFNDILYIKKEVHEKTLRGSKLRKGDVLIAIVGATIGQISLWNYNSEANINQAIALVRLKKEVNPRYVKSFLLSSVGQKQLDRLKRPVARANINLDEIRSIKIPLPPLEIQNKIVKIMDESYAQKKLKEKEAEKFLQSTDEYILNELGIKIPELKDKMCFIVNFSEVKENRIDVHYYQPKFEEVEKVIKKGKYPPVIFKQLFILLINGLDFREFSDEGIYYARVGNIKPNKIDLSDVKFIPKFNINKNIKLETGDLLITRKGSFGISCIVDEEHKNIVISSEIFRIKLMPEKLNPYYISTLLNTKLFQIIFDRIKTGGIMGHISQEVLSEIKIPLPPRGIQNKIAEEVKRRMQKAEELKEEARKVVEKAKEEIEKIIIGE